MNINFTQKALPLVLVFEGEEFTNHPNDKGGPTKWGIIQKVYDAYRLEKGLPKRSTKEIEIEEVQDIYFNKYWLPAKCELMEEKLSVVNFDIAVNMGVGRATKFLQTALAVLVDGDFGNKSVEALKKSNQQEIAKKVIQLRKDFYNKIVENNPSQSVFLKGWLRRVNLVEAYVNGTKTLEQIKKQW